MRLATMPRARRTSKPEVTSKISVDSVIGIAQKPPGKAWVKDGQWTLWKGG